MAFVTGSQQSHFTCNKYLQKSQPSVELGRLENPHSVIRWDYQSVLRMILGAIAPSPCQLLSSDVQTSTVGHNLNSKGMMGQPRAQLCLG